MMKNEAKVLVPDELVMNKIYFIRNQKVMLDSDLAELYGVTTGNLNKAVKRNIKRFPVDFMFRLDSKEYETLRFQNGILEKGKHSPALAGVITYEVFYLKSLHRQPFSNFTS
jgi:hypothetical protein